MSDKQLKDKAVNIKGKSYVLVSDRVVYFNETYPKGSITTDYILEGETFLFKATVQPEPGRLYTGHSQATIGDGMVNKTAAMENAETSAVGRALAMMGIGVIESIASVDEMNKATGSTGVRPGGRRISLPQVTLLFNMVKQGIGMQEKGDIMNWLQSVLDKSPTELRTDEFDGAMEKVKVAVREDKVMNGLPENPVTFKPDEIPADINFNDLPY